MSQAQSRALELFKDLIDLPETARRDALAALVERDAGLHALVTQLLARDAQAEAAFGPASLGTGVGQHVLAADIMASMLANQDTVPLDDGPAPEHIGPYRVIGLLGRGGMGVVYEAEQAEPLRRVAIKTIHAHLRTPDTIARFGFEMQALASLTHRSIPRLYEVRNEGGRTWMVMELVSGVPLNRYVAERPLRERLALFSEVLDGVAFAHAAGIGHRDLKAANILVADGQPRILDFGLAATLGGPDTHADLAGTLLTMAPEQLERGAVIDHRADIYALGVILYELLTGELPYRPTSLADARRLKREPPPRVSPRGLDRDLDFIVARAMACDPAQRYASVRALQADLAAHLALRPISARPNSLGYRVGRALRRQRTLVRGIAITLATVALVGVTFAIAGALDRADADRRREAAAAERLSELERRLADLDASGAHDEGDRLFSYFAALGDNAGTRALHVAWQHEATRQHARAREGAAIAAYINALSTARDDVQRDDALLALGDLLAARGDRAGVDRIAAALVGRERGANFVARARHYRRDFAAADTPLGDHLARGTPLGVVASTAGTLPGARFMVLDQPARALTVFDAAGGLHRSMTLHTFDDLRLEHWHPLQVAGLPTLLVGRSRDDDAALVELEVDRARLERVATLPLNNLSKAAGWHLPDGTTFVLVGSAGADRRLARWRSDSPELTPLPVSLTGPPSDLDSIAAADLDGDGRREVVIATGAWSSFELRVLRETSPGELALVTRRRFGSAAHVGLLRGAQGYVVSVVKSDRYPSAEVLGPATPYGAPAGVHLMRFDGTTLVDVAYAPFPIEAPSWVTPHVCLVGDLDGDGDDDLALAMSPFGAEFTAIYLQAPTLAPIVIGSAAPLALVQLDADPAAELVVRLEDHSGWVLGLGDTPLPVLPAAPTDRLEDSLEARLAERPEAPPAATTHTVIDDGRLHDAWRIERSGVTRHFGEPAAIGLESIASTVLMRLPIRVDGPASIDVALALQHLEIGSGLRLALVDGANHIRAQVVVNGTGGNTSIARVLGCGTAEADELEQSQRDIDAPDEHLSLHLALGATIACHIEHPGVDRARALVDKVFTSALEPGDYTLRVEGFGHPTWSTALVVRARIEHMILGGMTPLTSPESTLEQAHRAAFDGDHTRAVALYDALDAPLGGLRSALAIGHLDDIAARITRLAPAFVANQDGLWALVRGTPEAIATTLFEVDRAAFGATFANAWEIALRYLDDAAVQRFLELPVLTRLDGRSADELALVLAAARYELSTGAPQRAYRRLVRALETARPPDPEAIALEADLHLLAATAADALDWGADAREHFLTWLETSDATERDRLANRPLTRRLVAYLH